MRLELSRKGVTLKLLWEEYRNDHPEGDGYSWFCEQYGRHVKNLDVCFHHAYIGGETSFVDYSGTSIYIVDRETGEVKKTQLFVWTWGASNYTYLEFTQSQKIPDFSGSHQRGLAYFGCTPKQVVPDNLKSAVVTACRYESQLNFNYERLAAKSGDGDRAIRSMLTDNLPRHSRSAWTGFQPVRSYSSPVTLGAVFGVLMLSPLSLKV